MSCARRFPLLALAGLVAALLVFSGPPVRTLDSDPGFSLQTGYGPSG